MNVLWCPICEIVFFLMILQKLFALMDVSWCRSSLKFKMPHHQLFLDLGVASSFSSLYPKCWMKLGPRFFKLCALEIISTMASLLL